MKSAILPSYVFTASTGTLDLSMVPGFTAKKLYAVINLPASTLIYAVASAGLGYVSDAGGVLDLEFDTSAMNNSDELMIIYDDPIQAASYIQASISFVQNLTAPTLAKGFILQNLYSSNASIRYVLGGGAATASHGMQLEPGRDSGFVPCGANISICPESSTATYLLQWVIQT